MRAMNLKTALLALGWVLLSARPAVAQGGFYMPLGQRQIEFPFEYINNFMVVTVTFNGPLPLKFIFDTGAEHTILSKREISDLLQVTYEREFRVRGADLNTELVAYLARNIRLEIQGRPVVAPREDILVLQEDYFRFEEYAGVNVHGILAGQAFSRYFLKINYQRKVITLYDREWYQVRDPDFVPLPAEIFRNKIYLNTQAQILPDTIVPVKLLLDTGAGLPLLLFSNTHALMQPPANAVPSNIGMGLGGFLEGFTGRVYDLHLGAFEQKGVVTYFQALDTTQDLQYLNGRNGLVGNMILSRFQIILDYRGATVWLKPTKSYRQAFVYDRSGLHIIASGVSLNYFTVQSVLPGSPAAEADIRKGDRIVRVGLTPTNFLSLNDIQTELQKRPGKKIRLVLRRDGKRIHKKIVLRELI